MNPDGVSLVCDDGAHERCPGCACACHLYPTPPGVGDDAVPSGDPNLPASGATPHAHLDDL